MISDQIEIEVLEIAIKKITLALDELISNCSDDNGEPIKPAKKSLMRAKACLPEYCKNTLSKR